MTSDNGISVLRFCGYFSFDFLHKLRIKHEFPLLIRWLYMNRFFFWSCWHSQHVVPLALVISFTFTQIDAFSVPSLATESVYAHDVYFFQNKVYKLNSKTQFLHHVVQNLPQHLKSVTRHNDAVAWVWMTRYDEAVAWIWVTRHSDAVAWVRVTRYLTLSDAYDVFIVTLHSECCDGLDVTRHSWSRNASLILIRRRHCDASLKVT